MATMHDKHTALNLYQKASGIVMVIPVVFVDGYNE